MKKKVILISSLTLATLMLISGIIISAADVAPTEINRDLQTYNVPVGFNSLNTPVGGHAQADLPWWVGEGIAGTRFFQDPLGDDTTMEGEGTSGGLRFWRSADSEWAGHANNPVMGRRFGNNDENTWQWINIDAPLVFDIDATGNDALAAQQRNIWAWPIWRVRDPALGSSAVAVTLNLHQWVQQHWDGFIDWESGQTGLSNVRVTHNAPFRSLLEDMVHIGTQSMRNIEQAAAAQRVIDIAAANGGWFPIDRLTIMATVHHAGRVNLGPDNSAILREMSWGADANTVHANEQQFLSEGGGTTRPGTVILDVLGLDYKNHHDLIVFRNNSLTLHRVLEHYEQQVVNWSVSAEPDKAITLTEDIIVRVAGSTSWDDFNANFSLHFMVNGQRYSSVVNPWVLPHLTGNLPNPMTNRFNFEFSLLELVQHIASNPMFFFWGDSPQTNVWGSLPQAIASGTEVELIYVELFTGGFINGDETTFYTFDIVDLSSNLPTISATISTPSNNPITVQLIQNSTIVNTITLAPGVRTFTFENVNAGIYSIVITQAGSLSFTINNIQAVIANINLNEIDSRLSAITLTRGDVDGNGTINMSDLLDLLDRWGTNCIYADVDGNGVVNMSDLLDLLDNWGSSNRVVGLINP